MMLAGSRVPIEASRQGKSILPWTGVAQAAKINGARLFILSTLRFTRSEMIVSRPAPHIKHPGRGRHAIRRAGLFQEAVRLRHAHRVLPRGVHRTRVSEIRAFRVRGRIGATRPGSLERILAVRLPANTG
jgi:hypothetical protein